MKICIGNSYSQLTGFTTSQFAAIRKELSYTPPKNYAKPQQFNKPQYLIDSKGFFPTGLVVKLKAFLKAHNVPYTSVDGRVQPPKAAPLSVKGHVPYSDQQSAVAACLSRHRGIVSMPTGAGKSLVITHLVASLGVRTLIVVPTTELKKQLKETLLEALGSLKNITVENIDATALKTATNFDCLIIDESHHSAARTYRKLNKTAWKGIYYRFFFTATPFRNLEEEQVLFESVAGQKIYELTYKQAISKGYIVPVEAYYVDVPKQATDAYTYAQVYRELVVTNASRNAAIVDLLTSLHSAGTSALCLVKEIAHGEALTALAPFPFVNGQDEDSRGFIAQFNARKAKVLIGTTGIVSEGVDTKPCEYVIIAGLGKAKSQFMQAVGRAVRKYPGKESAKVIIFRDASHKFTLSHFNSQKKILLEEYGIKVVRLDL